MDENGNLKSRVYQTTIHLNGGPGNIRCFFAAEKSHSVTNFIRFSESSGGYPCLAGTDNLFETDAQVFRLQAIEFNLTISHDMSGQYGINADAILSKLVGEIAGKGG